MSADRRGEGGRCNRQEEEDRDEQEGEQCA